VGSVPWNANSNDCQFTDGRSGLPSHESTARHRRIANGIDIGPRVAAPQEHLASIADERITVISLGFDLMAAI